MFTKINGERLKDISESKKQVIYNYQINIVQSF